MAVQASTGVHGWAGLVVREGHWSDLWDGAGDATLRERVLALAEDPVVARAPLAARIAATALARLLGASPPGDRPVPHRMGVLVSTEHGNRDALAAYRRSVLAGRPSALQFSSAGFNVITAIAARAVGGRGPSLVLAGGSASFADACLFAQLTMARGAADRVGVLHVDLLDDREAGGCAGILVGPPEGAKLILELHQTCPPDWLAGPPGLPTVEVAADVVGCLPRLEEAVQVVGRAARLGTDAAAPDTLLLRRPGGGVEGIGMTRRR
jgi:hypothetical protein